MLGGKTMGKKINKDGTWWGRVTLKPLYLYLRTMTIIKLPCHVYVCFPFVNSIFNIVNPSYLSKIRTAKGNLPFWMIHEWRPFLWTKNHGLVSLAALCSSSFLSWIEGNSFLLPSGFVFFFIFWALFQRNYCCCYYYNYYNNAEGAPSSVLIYTSCQMGQGLWLSLHACSINSGNDSSDSPKWSPYASRIYCYCYLEFVWYWNNHCFAAALPLCN